jgi:hypothetical protein
VKNQIAQQDLTQVDMRQFQPTPDPNPVTLVTLDQKLNRILDRMDEIEERIDQVDSRVGEIVLDYGSGYSVDE